MKKILIIISNFNGVGGAETATYRFLNKVDRNIFKIDVCFFGFEDDFVLSVKRIVNQVFCIDAKKCGLISTYFKLLKLIKAEKYDILHTHLALADIYGLFLGFFTPVKLISTEHNLSDRRKVTTLGRIYYRLAKWRTNHFVGVSSKIIHWLKTIGVPEKKLVLIPNPIELNEIRKGVFSKRDFCEYSHWPDDSIIVGTVANFRPVKGLSYLIDSIKILTEAGFNVRLVIIGDGPERGNLENQIRANQLTGHVRLLGFRKDIRDLLPLFDLYVSPSLMEGFGISIVEAMSCGVPVVATEVGGVTDFLKHMKNSYLVKPGDPHALAEGISYLINNKTEAVKFSACAYNDAHHYETDDLVKYLEKLYMGDAHNFRCAGGINDL
ncbi:MAG: putative glycosyltransferase EpsF [Pelotomaculum sp. PtaB.Bin013]|uniref:Glycosyltransferase n=1 Tax=Pelotomaculum isophthalicicum JI TaxID=947010 RepID=A0A9X4H153_9FIRM|nr:glycosyltransferase [Pelotomaculum isophthalicicum]MDF9407851.1 glycosyltransferase [Pelotomaculum isophthalicicum JI]OPX85006.1 MAG: putative glycosyltransferase EpsF [Pelotomaculum sp. PtaB.Bin013]